MKAKYIFASFIVVSFFLTLVTLTGSASAASLNFSWSKQYNDQVEVSGGQLNSGQSITFNDAIGTKGSRSLQAIVKTTGWFWTTNDTPCKITFTYETKSDNSLLLTNGNTTGTPSAGEGGTPECSTFDEDTTSQLFNNTTVTISGTRLSTTESQERPDQKFVGFEIYTGTDKDPPQKITLKITGQASSTETLSRLTYSTGSKEYYWYSTQKSLEPGSYKACVEGISVACENFTKEKFKSIGASFGTLRESGYYGVELGSQVASEQSRAIEIKLNVTTSTICESTTLGPYTFTLQNKAGKKLQNVDTASRQIKPDNNPACGSSATGTSTYSFSATLDDVDPGDYKVCLDTNCKSVTKKDNVQAQVAFDLSGADASNLVQSTGQGTNTCDIQGVGWIICPVTNFMANITDNVYKLIAENLLVVNAEAFNTNSETFKSWTWARNIANTGLIAVFTIIIFAQVTGMGISNYGVKKMLPRLLIAAVLANLSFYICQIAVDLSNILGSSLYNFLAPETTTDVTWAVLVAGLLAGGFAVSGAGLGLILPILLAVILAVLVTLLILVGREVVLILLVVLSPIAFLAFVLPNTNSWFSKWRSTLTALLLVYPMVALLFGGSALASEIITQTYSGIGLGKIFGLAIAVLPLFLLPSLLKRSLDAIPAAGRFAQKMQGRANAMVSGKARAAVKGGDFARSRAASRAELDRRRNVAYAERTVAGGVRGTASRAGGLGATEAVRRAAQDTLDQAEGEQRTREEALYDDAWKDQARTLTHQEKVQRIQSGTLSASVAQAAARDVMRTGDQASVSSLLGHASSAAGADIRDTVARTAGESPAISSSAHLNAADITRTLNTPGGAIDQTYIDRQISTKAQQGGYTRTAMANMSTHDAELLANAAGRMTAGSSERQALVNEAQDALTDPRLAVVHNSDLGRHLTAIANMTP